MFEDVFRCECACYGILICSGLVGWGEICFVGDYDSRYDNECYQPARSDGCGFEVINEGAHGIRVIFPGSVSRLRLVRTMIQVFQLRWQVPRLLRNKERFVVSPVPCYDGWVGLCGCAVVSLVVQVECS